MEGSFEEDSFSSEDEPMQKVFKRPMKRNPTYDEKIPHILVKIHRDAAKKGFHRWIEKNQRDLRNLHRISELDISFYEFVKMMYPDF